MYLCTKTSHHFITEYNVLCVKQCFYYQSLMLCTHSCQQLDEVNKTKSTYSPIHFDILKQLIVQINII